MITAQLSSVSCPRCTRPINRGDRIEAYYSRTGDKRRWAHVGCDAQSPACREEPGEYHEDYPPPQNAPSVSNTRDIGAEKEQQQIEGVKYCLQESMKKAQESMQQNGQMFHAEPPVAGALAPAPKFAANGAGGSAVAVNPAKAEAMRLKLAEMIREEVNAVFNAQAAEQTARLNNAIEGINGAVASAFGQIEELAVKAAKEAVKDLPLLKTIEIKVQGREAVKITGELLHESFADVLMLASAGKNILLVGPTGCGKSHLAEQIARVIPNEDGTKGRTFGAISCTAGLTEAKLLGRANMNLSNGQDTYQVSDFVRIYENGGIFLLDEMDGCDPNLLLVVNSALANGFMPLPDRRDNPIARRHKDFVMIATANTYGHGGDRRYCGRFPLDKATLDRFKIGTIDMNYSRDVERKLCPNVKLLETLWGWRKKMEECRIEDNLSTRFIIDVRDMLAAGWPMGRIEKSFFAGWRRDEIIKVLGRDVGS